MRQIACTFMVLTSCVLQAQVSVTWTNRYSGPTNAHDYSRGIAVDASGNSYVVGVSAQAYAYQSIIITTKHDAAGAILWTNVWGDAQILNQAIDIQLDSAGDVLVYGISKTSVGSDLVLIKYSDSGVELWVQRFNALRNNRGSAMTIDSLNHIYLTGTTSEGELEYEFLTLEYDPAGNLLWSQAHSVSETVAVGPGDIAVDDQGHVVVAGAMYSPSGPAWTVLLKYDTDGALIWDNIYASSPHPQRVIFDTAGDMYVGTSTNRYIVDGPVTTQVSDFLVLKYSSAGDLVWSRTYRSPVESQSSHLMDIAVDSARAIYATGGGGTPLTVKWDSAGTKQWVNRYFNERSRGGSGHQIIPHTNGAVYVGGYTYDHQEDFVAVKYDGDGNQKWEFAYDQNGERNFLSGFVIGPSGLFLTGSSKFVDTGPDMLTLRLDEFPVVGLPEILSRSQDVEIITGQNDVELSVSVESPTPVSYQWRFNGRDIVGATQSWHTITSPNLDDTGEYSVRVSNAVGMTVSPEARLTVRQTVVISMAIINAEGLAGMAGSGRIRERSRLQELFGPGNPSSSLAVVIQVTTTRDQTIEVQISDDLVEWETLVSGATSAEGSFTYIDAADRQRKFYRAVAH